MMKKIEANRKKTVKNTFVPAEIEPKWQAIWEEEAIYQPILESATGSTSHSTLRTESSGSDSKSSPRSHPFYNLMMFPYPSAEGLHVGSMYAFGGADVYGRFKRMQGFAVFEPIGLDGFGIHSENHAIKTNSHPLEHAKRTEQNFYRQLRSIGNGYAWKNKVETYDPSYYKWTQWLFIELFKAGLAYRKKSPVNFCPSCKTVLSDEQVINGKCERCSSVVEKRNLEQWFFRITKYANRLLANIPKLDWTEKVKIAQREWIGRKEGINIVYPVILGTQSEAWRTPESKRDPGQARMTNKQNGTITVFTTRPDTNFGATFIAIAPEHELVEKILNGEVKASKETIHEIKEYIAKVKTKSEIERQAEGREKTGVFTGLYALNPLTGYQMPIWVSDFVLAGFGTGALVGVPGHDKRDFEFATKFGLEIKRVVVGNDGDTSPITRIEQVQEEEGIMMDSDFLNGMDIHEATEKMMDYMEVKGYGSRETTYHLRDWLISRQRYWGPPIPMIYCEACAKKGLSWFTGIRHSGKEQRDDSRIQERSWASQDDDWDASGWYPVPERDLPVELPYIEDFRPLGTGKSPLANHPEFYTVKCPHCGAEARRETDVSDNFLDSSWYFFRYLATDRDDVPFPSSFWQATSGARPESERDAGQASMTKKNKSFASRARFLPVTMYIGGAEHSVLHLLYARFISMFLHDQGYIDFEEPFSRFYAHGLIIKEGAKMSKSKGNVVVPDEYINKFGADTLRTYLMFLGPFNQGGDFRDSGIEGMYRFLKRVWRLIAEKALNNAELKTRNNALDSVVQRNVPLSSAALRMMHGTIKGVTDDMEHLRFNTAIAKLMTWCNYLVKKPFLSREEAGALLQLLAPFAPHMTEELWQKMRNESGEVRNKKFSILNSQFSIHTSLWPSYDPAYLQEQTVKIPIQVNGKLRAILEIDAGLAINRKDIKELARQDERVKSFIEGKQVKQVIYVEGKVVNFVVAD